MANNWAGSYGGALSALYRVHYPDVIHGALAAAPPTKGIVSDPKNPLVYAYTDWVCIISP